MKYHYPVNLFVSTLIGLQAGPFYPNVPVTVPLWVAVYLRQQQKCRIIPPDWMTVERLTQCKDREESDSNCTDPPHRQYMEITTLLLHHAPDDMQKFLRNVVNMMPGNFASLSTQDPSDSSGKLLQVSSKHRLSDPRWPCYLSDCVSEKWLPDDICVQLWNGLGESPTVHSLSYAKFEEFSDNLAAVLFNQWMKFKLHSTAKRIVAILWRPHILTSVAVHSVVKSGAAFYPVAYEFSADLSLLGDQLIAVICLSSSAPRAEVFESFDAYRSDSEMFRRSDWCLFLRRPPNVHPPSFSSEIPNNPTSLLAYVITTSGSSGGSKKLVFVAHSCLTANIVDLQGRFGTTDVGQPEGRTVLLTAPLTFDPSLVQIYFALATRRCLVCPGPGILLHRDSLLSLCTEAKVQWLQCTPSLFMSQSARARAKLLAKRGLSIILGGEPFPWLALPRLQNAEAAVYSIYGITEVSSWATICRVDRHTDDTANRCGCPAPIPGSTPIGFPMLATELNLGAPTTRHSYVLTVSRKFGGFAVFIMRDASVTEKQFIDVVETLPSNGPWSTGDLVTRGRCEQCLWFVGRTDRMIKRYGQRICLEQLEMAIVQCSLPNADVCFCTCDLFGHTGRQGLLAVVGVSPHSTLKQSYLHRGRQKFRSHIINHVKRCFAPNYVPWLPTKIIFCGRAPSFSPHGKILRRPRNKGRLTVTYIWNRWAAAAGSPGHHLNYDSTFFEIGGSSLPALRLIETLVQQYPNLVTSKEKLLTLIFTADFRSFVQHLLEARDRTPILVDLSSSTLLSEAGEADQLSSTPTKCTQAINGGNILQATLHSTNQLLLELQWTSHLGKCVDAPALIVCPTSGSTSSPVVCIGSHSGQLACFDLITGEKQWCADGSVVGGRIEAGAAYALSNSVEFVSVGTLSGKLCTFDLASGMLLWTFDTGGAIKSAPKNLHSRNLFVLGSHGRAIHAVDVRFPLRATWSNTFDNSPIVSEISSYDDSDTYLLATSLGGTVGCIDIRKPCVLLWKSGGMAPIFTKATLSCLSTNERRVMISAVDGRMRSFDSLSGQLVWQSTMSLLDKQCQVFKDPLWDPHDQELLVASNCGLLFGVEASTGTSKWVLDCRPNATGNGPTQLNTPSIIYACTDSSTARRKIIVLSRADGRVLIGAYPSADETSRDSHLLSTYTCYQLPNHSFSSPVICTEPESNVIRLAVGCRDDNLYCFTLK
ncbi:hypothetical protein T265_03080 [Opisthorchis viverrini]|uniref:Carrier domain-containing protein n=1 Tax=Opisthorchis viverrini TaxID=6198 RepID=A0A074ZX08_OPIVI|nr:hypothetical protein T265_03080 [Opisthorchis viverrini]KER30467.1 hypothetical protein T265_03080 [Opisthorchis viverrini]